MEVSKQTYQYIINTEILLLTEFHINAIDLFNNLTLLDLYAYIAGIEKNVADKNKRYSNTKALATQLYMLREVLNSM